MENVHRERKIRYILSTYTYGLPMACLWQWSQVCLKFIRWKSFCWVHTLVASNWIPLRGNCWTWKLSFSFREIRDQIWRNEIRLSCFKIKSFDFHFSFALHFDGNFPRGWDAQIFIKTILFESIIYTLLAAVNVDYMKRFYTPYDDDDI